MNKISLRQIKDSLPAEKNRADSLWTRWILRPVSIPVAWLLLRFGLRANTVSYLSGLLCIPAGILLNSHSFGLALTGALLFNLFAVLDCADGNMARATGTSGPFGGWADALGGYLAYVSVLLAVGMAAAGHSAEVLGWRPQGELWVFLGGLAAVSNILMRLVYQSYRNIAPEGQSAARKSIGLEKVASENLGVTGLLMPAVLAGLLVGGLGYVVVFYTLFYTLGCVVSLLKLIGKVEHAAGKK